MQRIVSFLVASVVLGLFKKRQRITLVVVVVACVRADRFLFRRFFSPRTLKKRQRITQVVVVVVVCVCVRVRACVRVFPADETFNEPSGGRMVQSAH